MNSQAEASVVIENDLGLHARAATVFVQVASRYDAEIFVGKDDREVNGKSIMGILTLVASKGSSIVIRAQGPDAKEAVKALCRLVKEKFGEDH